MISVEELVYLLKNTYNPDNNVRQNSERKLKEFESNPTFLPSLLQLIASSNISLPSAEILHLKLAAAIMLKNHTKNKWITTKKYNTRSKKKI